MTQRFLKRTQNFEIVIVIIEKTSPDAFVKILAFLNLNTKNMAMSIIILVTIKPTLKYQITLLQFSGGARGGNGGD